jgi:hypothetical protein
MKSWPASLAFVGAFLTQDTSERRGRRGDHGNGTADHRNIIDSMALMRLVAFVEERTTVRIPDDEILPENFNTVEAIDARVVQRLQARR